MYMPPPPAAGLALSETERKQLIALGRHRSSSRGIVLRIDIVLGAAEGLANRVLIGLSELFCRLN